MSECVGACVRLRHESGERTDDEIEQLADLSLEAKAFGHFFLGSIDLKEHEAGTGVNSAIGCGECQMRE